MMDLSITRTVLVLALFFSLFVVHTNSSFGSAVKTSSNFDIRINEQIEKQVQCLAKNIYHEARGESYEGKLAVAQVTMNRTKSEKYPSDVCEVVYQRTKRVCQFSWTCTGNNMITDSEMWENSLEIARKAFTQVNLHETLANANALFYHANYVRPGWKKSGIVAQIGRHIFYTRI